MLTKVQYEEFEANGVVVLRRHLDEDALRSLTQALDGLQAGTPYKNGRWDMRNCLPRHPVFSDVLVNEVQLAVVVQVLGFNTKLLGSHVVKIQEDSGAGDLCVEWHRDGGALLAELPDPLPLLFIKTGFCISGSSEPEGGELLMVPGSHRLNGEPPVNSIGSPFGVSRVLLTPGDMVIFDWRVWHAVSSNVSNVIRRMLYFTFGFRWLTPFDYQVIPEELLNRSPVHRQLLGGATELGNILPTDEDVPLKKLQQEGGE